MSQFGVIVGRGDRWLLLPPFCSFLGLLLLFLLGFGFLEDLADYGVGAALSGVFEG